MSGSSVVKARALAVPRTAGGWGHTFDQVPQRVFDRLDRQFRLDDAMVGGGRLHPQFNGLA